MSKISKAVADMQGENVLRKSETVTNFMGGDSYTVDPITRLRLVTASSIFGEPSYYRDAKVGNKTIPSTIRRMGYDRGGVFSLLKSEDILGVMDDKDTVTLMEEVIDAALDYDFKATLDWAVELRNNFYIRLNPQVIMVRAAIHPKRAQFTSEFNGAFNSINRSVMARPDDALSQISYYMYINKGKKNNIPSVIKRSWANHFSELNRYSVAKYKNHDIGMINAVRICHAKSEIINELMRTGTVEVSEKQKTWENMRSAGKSWKEIFETINMGHMAMLRNMRNFLQEVDDIELAKKYMEKLKSGVLTGKQFPFRYYTAYKTLENDSREDINFLQLALDTLEECIDISIENMPKLKGRTMCLSDNSGSAWGGFTSEYGSVVVAEIDNLSSVITAMRSDEGYVGKFGDRLRVFPISKRKGALQQAREISKDNSNDVGGGTEGGIWEFFYNAMEKKEHWDNIFIYSDQQAGTAGLYGTVQHKNAYTRLGYSASGMINVFKLVLDYRKKVNAKVNVFSVQTAGYDNMVVPNYAYRTNLMYGWTGKEIVFAEAVIREWDQVDGQKKSGQKKSRQKKSGQTKLNKNTK